METNITENFFEYETNKYFRGNAHSQQIGSYGRKKDPIGAKAYLEVINRVKAENLEGRVHYTTTARIDWNKTKKAEVEAEGSFKFFGLNIKTAQGGGYEKAKSANLVLTSFAINEGPLQRMLNEDADGARKCLADEGKDGRFVSEIWLGVEGELAEHFATSSSFSVSANAAGTSLDITAKGGKHGSQVITVAPNVVFAYKLHKVTEWNKDKTRIEKMAEDFHS